MLEGRPSLDSPALRGRLRTQVRRSEYERRPVRSMQGTVMSDVHRPVRQQVKSPTPAPVAPKSAPAKAITSPISAAIPAYKPTKAYAATGRPRKHEVASTTLHARASASRVLKRQGVQAPHTRRKNSSKRSLRSLFTIRNLLTGFAVLIVLSGIGIGIHSFKVNQDVAAKTTDMGGEPATNSDADGGNDLPSETPVGNVDGYRVAGTLPRVISIEKFGVKARTIRLGVKASNQLAAPANIYDAGWYEASSKPGEAGAMVIDGHVSGPTKPGVFYNLQKLVAGDHIKVENGNGKIYTYKVVKKTTYAADKVDMAAALTPVTSGKPGLNLITCAGEIDRATNHYKDRTVVFAELL